jgi:pimeloyl-ACP methyl ester carboxylesterase
VISRGPTEDGPGAGSLVVMVHGAMDRATSFRRVWNHLPDFDLVAYDRRGYAGSLDVVATEEFSDQVGDLISVLAGRTATVVLGHSFGGNVALATAAARPDLVSSVVVYEPPAPWLSTWPGRIARPERLSPQDEAEAFMRRMVGDRVWERLPIATRALRRAEGPTLLTELAALRAHAPFDPASVTVPVVVGYGTGGLPHAARWAEELSGLLPDAELAVVEGAPHGIHLSNPAALADLVRQAAARALPGQAS